jgi:lysyl-tRNA synthetase class I
MSRFPDSIEEEPKRIFSGPTFSGAFECNTCGKIVTSAIHNRDEERLVWECPDGHSNSVNFKL